MTTFSLSIVNTSKQKKNTIKYLDFLNLKKRAIKDFKNIGIAT